MALLFWDASALVKRYLPEIGSDTANALFAALPLRQMATTAWGYAETYSILIRRFNAGDIDATFFTTAVSALQAEVVDHPDFKVLTIPDAIVFDSVRLMRKHNLNATDAAILALLLDVQDTQPPSTPGTVMVSADVRLLRAANSEGLRSLNPEILRANDVPAFCAGL